MGADVGPWCIAFFCSNCDGRQTRRKMFASHCPLCRYDRRSSPTPSSYQRKFRIHRRRHWWLFWHDQGTEWLTAGAPGPGQLGEGERRLRLMMESQASKQDEESTE